MVKESPRGVIGAITKFQLSGAYPVVFALLCAISSLAEKNIYFPVFCLLAALVLFSAIFVKDNKVLIPPILMMYYALGTDTYNAFIVSDGSTFAAFDSDSLTMVIAVAAVLGVALVVRFILDGTFKYALTHRSMIFWGVVALDCAFLLNGAFSPFWTWECLAYGAIMAAGLSVSYLVLFPIIDRSDKEIIDYTCRSAVAMSYVILIQVVVISVIAYQYDSLVRYDTIAESWMVCRTIFHRSWGIATIVGGAVVLGIPAALKLAHSKRFPIFHYISAILFFLVACLVNTRSAMLFGALTLLAGIILICFSGKNRKINLIFTCSLICLAVTAACVIIIKLNDAGTLEYYFTKTLSFFRLNVSGERLDIYEKGWQDVSNSFIFGEGVSKGGFTTAAENTNAFGRMYHNILLQFAASMGLLGIFAFLFHIKDYFLLGIKKINVARILLLSLPLMIICMSLFDNFFFYPNFQIFYVAFFALAQKDFETT